MSRPHRGAFEAWLRGGQTVGHTWDMVMEVVLRLGIVAVLLAIVVALIANSIATPREQSFGFLALEAWTCRSIGKPLPQKVSASLADGRSYVVPVSDVTDDPVIGPAAARYARIMLNAVFIWLWLVAIMGLVAAQLFLRAGHEKIRSRQLRGQDVTRLADLIPQVTAFNVAEAARRGDADFEAPKLIGVPYPYHTEMEHTLVVGAPGAGKSQAIHQLVESIRAKGERAIIFDPELDYIRHHFDEKTDTILNPFDARSPGWTPFHDAVDSADWRKLGHAIFKDPRSGDPYWVSVARSLFSWTGYCLRERLEERRGNALTTGELLPDRVELDELLDLLFGPPKQLKSLLAGTPAGAHLQNLDGPRVASLLSVLSDGVEPLIYLYGKQTPFSIREWVNRQSDETGLLFLSAPESHMDSLRPLLGFWCELAVGAVLSRHEISRRPTWFILDEFHSAGRIDKLADGPQRLRKYGGAVVLGFQQFSQLQDLYGPDKARTIIGQCQTKLILRAGDFETAELMSEQLGRRVIRRVEENTSYGANAIRDGVGLAPKEELEAVVLPEDVLNFPKFHGMIRLSNARPAKPFPIAPIKLAYVDRPTLAPGFVRAPSDPVKQYLASVEARGAAAEANVLNPDRPITATEQPVRPGAATLATTAPKDGGLARFGIPTATLRSASPPSEAAPATAAGEDSEPVRDPDAQEEEVGEVEASADKSLRPRRTDLPTDEALRLRRQEDADEERRNAAAAATRRDDASESKGRVSMFQRRDGLLVTESEYLAGVETATRQDLAYAEAHRFDKFNAIVQLGAGALAGGNVDFRGPWQGRDEADDEVGDAEGSQAGGVQTQADGRDDGDIHAPVVEAPSGLAGLDERAIDAFMARHNHLRFHGHHHHDRVRDRDGEEDRDGSNGAAARRGREADREMGDDR